jgi:hypothetical protein
MMNEVQKPHLHKTDVSGSVLPNVVASERKLREMTKLHKPKEDNGKSDFYLAWRLCYEWMSGTDR